MDHSEELLNSWKEISEYLQRGVRTVQRWERDLHLPVRRPRGKKRSPVVAVRSELDHWLRSCPMEALAERALKQRAPSEGPRFLMAALDFGLTLTQIALGAPPEEEERIRKSASKANAAYRTVLRLRDRVLLDEPEKRKLETRLEQLKAALQGLGQAV